MAVDQETVFREHPCFGACKNKRGRIHLPVAPGCNIECRFCDRRINEDAQIPGNTSKVIKPEEACGYIRKALEYVPELTTVGIAGPGDTLATPFALDTFRLVKKDFPKLLRCMSTNGLLLNDKADEVIDAWAKNSINIDKRSAFCNFSDAFNLVVHRKCSPTHSSRHTAARARATSHSACSKKWRCLTGPSNSPVSQRFRL